MPLGLGAHHSLAGVNVGTILSIKCTVDCNDALGFTLLRFAAHAHACHTSASDWYHFAAAHLSATAPCASPFGADSSWPQWTSLCRSVPGSLSFARTQLSLPTSECWYLRRVQCSLERQRPGTAPLCSPAGSHLAQPMTQGISEERI